MNAQVPDPLRDAAGFHAWSLMYLERTLSADDERAFEKLLVSSKDAAAAFASAAQLDTDLHECLAVAPAVARIPASPMAAEILDPRNVSDMRFVSDVCGQIRVSAAGQARDKNASQRVMAVRRARRYWLPSLAAAGLAAAVTAYAIHDYSTSGTNPSPGRSQPRVAHNKIRTDKFAVEPQPVETTPNSKWTEGGSVVARELPEPMGDSTKREGIAEVVELAPPPVEDPRVVESPKREVDPVPARTNELPLTPGKTAPQPPAEEPVAPIDEADGRRLADTAAWRSIGTLALKRESEKVEIDLKYEGNAFDKGKTFFGGIVYRKPLVPARGAAVFKLVVDSDVLSSSEHDFQFVLNNVSDRSIYLSVKDQLAAVKDKLDLAARQHVFELVVRKFNVFEVRIDGITTHTITEDLNRYQWEKIYLGFRTSSRGSEAQPAVVQDVSLKYLEK